MLMKIEISFVMK